MSTTNMNNKVENVETDILSIIRELEAKNAPTKTQEDSDVVQNISPDPAKLLASLTQKRELINLIDGYAEVKDIAGIKKELNAAIADLEEIIETSDQ
ncbi:MAG: hypothetical protein ABH871_09320 [Pseudomonadota bacterium]